MKPSNIKRLSGRNIFPVVRPILTAATMALRIIPRALLTRSWWAVEWFPGLLGVGLRYAYAKRLCRQCGDLVQIGPGVAVYHWEHLSIGDNVNIHRQCYVDALGSIEIGDNVSIAHATSLLSFDHSWSDRSRPIKYNPLIERPITIGSDVWVGCGVRILSGASLAPRTIIAAGAVVTQGIYSSGIYGGVPAKRISDISRRNETEREFVTS